MVLGNSTLNESLAILLLSLIYVACYFTLPGIAHELTHADALYLPTLFQDILRAPFQAHGWNLTPAPYFFPDMGYVFLIDWFVDDTAWVIFLSSYVQVLLLLFGGYSITRALGITNSLPFINIFALFFFSIVLMGLYVDPAMTHRWYIYLLLTGHHFGAFLAAVWSACLSIAYWRGSRAALIALILVAMAATFSDALYIFYFALPALATLATHFLVCGPQRRSFLLGSLIGLTSAGTYLVQKQFNEAAKTYIGERTVPFVEESMRLAQDVWGGTGEARLVSLFMLFTWLATLIFFSLKAFRILHREEQRKELFYWAGAAVFLFTSGVGVIAAVLYLGLHKNVMTFRYLLSLAYWPVIMAGVAAGVLMQRRTLFHVAAIGVLSLSMLGASVISSRAETLLAPTHRLDPPNYVGCFSDSEGGVIAGYWQSKPIVLYSDFKVQVAQVDPKGRPFLWINNSAWYTRSFDDKENPPTFNRIFLRGLDETAIRERFGDPDSVEECFDSRIFYYEDEDRVYRKLILPSRQQFIEQNVFPSKTLPANGVLDFSVKGDGWAYLQGEWSTAESWGRWTDGANAAIRFRMPRDRSLNAVEVVFVPFVPPGEEQRVDVYVNGVDRGTWTFTNGQMKSRLIALETIDRGEVEIEFEIRYPTSPLEVGKSNDRRRLGVGLIQLRGLTRSEMEERSNKSSGGDESSPSNTEFIE